MTAKTAQARSILLVDDEEDLLEVVSDTLSSAGYRVMPAKCGGEALEILKTVEPGIVLLDLMLPDMSGFDVCKEIKRRARGYLPVIILTARRDMESLVQGLGDAGADDYVVKPFRREELIARISAGLRIKDLYDVIRSQNDLLTSLSITDDLTGLGNRRYLTAMLSARIMDLRHSPGEMACALVDLDQFKRVNDLCGHMAGDDVLRAFAAILKAASPDNTICGRWGGDEFLVLFPDGLRSSDAVPEAAVQKWADGLVALMETEKPGAAELAAATAGGPASYVGVTGGAIVIRGPEPRLDPVRIIGGLDRLLYTAKKKGRNQFAISMDQSTSRAGSDAESARAGQERSVFVLDDNVDICAIVRDMLTRRNIVTETFQTKESLFAALDKRWPDLILLDLKMPDTDGTDVCRVLKQRPDLRLTKIALLTAFSSDEVRDKAADAGADGVILKPFTYAGFLDQVTRLIDLKK